MNVPLDRKDCYRDHTCSLLVWLGQVNLTSFRNCVSQDYLITISYYTCPSYEQGFFRYWIPSIKKFLGEFLQTESIWESALRSMLQRLIVQFCGHHLRRRQFLLQLFKLRQLVFLFNPKEVIGRMTVLWYLTPSYFPHFVGSCSLNCIYQRLCMDYTASPGWLGLDPSC